MIADTKFPAPMMNPFDQHDNGGRRAGIDRRRFDYAAHIPERRGDKDRRSGFDRRTLRHTTGIPQAENAT
jgi:hypothetical protein